MKNIIKLLLVFLCFGCGGTNAQAKKNIVDLKSKSKKDFLDLKRHLETGDLIFQYTNTRVARVTESLNGSPITHVGMVVRRGNRVYVFEASKRVKFTTLKKFLLKSKNGWFSVQTPKQKLTDSQIEKLKENTRNWVSKPYDLQFSWKDDKIYCTELVYKMYEEIGIKISELTKISEILDDNPQYKNPALDQYIKKVHGSRKNIDKDEWILTPLNLFYSKKLKVVRNINSNIRYDTFPYYDVESGP